MKKPSIRATHGPEWRIQQELIKFLRARGWLVEVMQGNMYQMGVPDLYLYHRNHGTRWVDVKNPISYTFTKAQRRKWPVWESFGLGIWILVGVTEEEYDKLWAPPNWREYWKPQWDQAPTVEELLQDLDNEKEILDE